MDRHTRWLRRRIAVSTATRVALEAGGVVGVSVVGMALANVSPASIGPWSAVAAQAWTGSRVAFALRSNPLNHRFLDHYTNRAMSFELGPHAPVSVASDDEDPDPILVHRSTTASELQALGFHPVASGHMAGDDEQSLDIYQPADRSVVAIVSATTLLVTRLTDGRMLVTTSMLTAPNEALIVNFCPGGDARQLLGRHRRGLDNLKQKGIGPAPCGPGLVSELLHAEREAFAALGPFFGSFLALEGKPKPHLLQTGIEPGELLRLALSPQYRSDSPPTSGDQTAVATPPSAPVPPTLRPAAPRPVGAAQH